MYKVTEFLNHMHDVCRYQLATVNQRIDTVERKLDYLEASLKNSDPAKREKDTDDFDFSTVPTSGEHKPKFVKDSIFERSTRYSMIRDKVTQLKAKRGAISYNNRVIKPILNENENKTHTIVTKSKVAIYNPATTSGAPSSTSTPTAPHVPSYPVSKVSTNTTRSTIKLKSPPARRSKGM